MAETIAIGQLELVLEVRLRLVLHVLEPHVGPAVQGDAVPGEPDSYARVGGNCHREVDASLRSGVLLVRGVVLALVLVLVLASFPSFASSVFSTFVMSTMSGTCLAAVA